LQLLHGVGDDGGGDRVGDGGQPRGECAVPAGDAGAGGAGVHRAGSARGGRGAQVVGSVARRAPWMLSGLRAVLAPGVLVMAVLGAAGAWMIAVAALALVSDYFDGVVARAMGVDTDGLRAWDSRVDTLFYFAAGIALFVRFPVAWHEAGQGVAILVAVELG